MPDIVSQVTITPMPASLSLAAILADSADRYAERPAVVVGGQATTYAQLWLEARQYAAVLRARGVGPGDRVALLLPNTAHFPRAYFGVLALGGTVVPVHALLKAEEIAYVLRDSGAVALVCAAPLLGEGAKGAELAGVGVLSVLQPEDTGIARLDALAAQAEPVASHVPRAPTDTAVILYTSGTTGQPKGAEISHLNVIMNVDASVISSFDYGVDDVVLGCLPLFHTFGQTCAMNVTFRVGATLVLVPRFDGPGALDLLVTQRCTIFMGVPTMYVALLEAARTDDRRPPLRAALSGGAAIPLTVLERFQEVFGVDVYEGYGLTETSPVATFNQTGRAPRPGTVGRPIWGVEVEIARPELEEAIELLPRGELGEIVVRGHNVMTGYLGRPEETAKAIVDGWFRTGDLGTKDDEDYVTIVDRKKDMVIRGGYNVYPREVEEAMLRHPGVGQVAVIGVPHEHYGEEVLAVVVRSAEGGDLLAAELSGWSRERLAAYKYPRLVEFVDHLPLGPSGKVLKRELTLRFGAPAGAPARVPSGDRA